MKIALIGSAPSSVHLAPYEDKSWQDFREGLPHPNVVGVEYPSQFVDEKWECWGCSPALAGQARRCTRFFEVHRWQPGKDWFQPSYMDFLKEFKGPVYTGQAIPEIPNHVVYPLEEVEEEFSSYFLTSSLSLMCALAILEIEKERARDVKHDWMEDTIAFFGVDMAAAEEYGFQRAGCQHFILETLKRDIGIYVPPESCLLKPMPVYGICEWDHKPALEAHKNLEGQLLPHVIEEEIS